MYFQQFLPSKPLRSYIQMFGLYSNSIDLAFTTYEVLPPFICKGLIFHYYENRDISVSKKAYTGKLPLGYFLFDNNEQFVLSSRKKFEAVGVIFQPGQFRHFFPFDTTVHIDKYLTFQEYNDPDLIDLHEQIAMAQSVGDRIRLLDHFFLRQLSGVNSREQNTTGFILQEMFTNREWKLYESASSLDVSERHLRRTFKRELGLSPKRYHRILRFSKALDHLNNHHFSTLTQLAYSVGYSEQKHFILDFKEFMGVTPSQYISKVSPVASSIFWKEEVEDHLIYEYNHGN
jgi:AraC-like DNA-binding protein